MSIGGGYLFVMGIFLSGILCVLCLVMGIIQFAYSKKGKYFWLAGFLLSVILLIVCIFGLIDRVASKAGGFMKQMESSMTMLPDSNDLTAYNFSDSLHSEQIQKLKKMEPEENKGNVPEQFYNYLGFRDYYRLPLRFPYSIHCMETPGAGDLYDESSVERFDVNNNGEKDCGLNNICAISFDETLLLAKCLYNEGKKKEFKYYIYHFGSKEKEECEDERKMFAKARENKFKGSYSLTDCGKYFEKF